MAEMKMCGATTGEGMDVLYCTLQRGHAGDHAAHLGLGGPVLRRWPQARKAKDGEAKDGEKAKDGEA